MPNSPRFPSCTSMVAMTTSSRRLRRRAICSPPKAGRHVLTELRSSTARLRLSGDPLGFVSGYAPSGRPWRERTFKETKENRMTTQMTLDATAAPPRRLLRSAAAVLAALIAVFALSLGIDQLLHVLEVYPPWGEPMHDHGLNLLAPLLSDPDRHSGRLHRRSTCTARADASRDDSWLDRPRTQHCRRDHRDFVDVGPSWYPIALVITALPCAWLGGALHRKLRRGG